MGANFARCDPACTWIAGVVRYLCVPLELAPSVCDGLMVEDVRGEAARRNVGRLARGGDDESFCGESLPLRADTKTRPVNCDWPWQ